MSVWPFVTFYHSTEKRTYGFNEKKQDRGGQCQRPSAYALLVQRVRQADRCARQGRGRKRPRRRRQRLLFDGRLQGVERRMPQPEAVPVVQHRVHQPPATGSGRRRTGQRPEQSGPHLPQRQGPRLSGRTGRAVRLAAGRGACRVERSGRNDVRQAERRTSFVRCRIRARLQGNRADADQRIDPRASLAKGVASGRIRAPQKRAESDRCLLREDFRRQAAQIGRSRPRGRRERDPGQPAQGGRRGLRARGPQGVPAYGDRPQDHSGGREVSRPIRFWPTTRRAASPTSSRTS